MYGVMDFPFSKRTLLNVRTLLVRKEVDSRGLSSCFLSCSEVEIYVHPVRGYS